MGLFRRIIILLSIAFFANCHISYAQDTAAISDNPDNKKTILVVSSYGVGQSWSTNIAKKLQHSIEREDSSYVVIVEYTNSEKYDTYLSSRFGMQSAFFNAVRRGQIPDLLIFIGDEAWMTYKGMTLRAWSKIPIIVCNVEKRNLKEFSSFFDNFTIADSLITSITDVPDTLRHFTAITRSPDYRASVDLIRKINPKTKELLFISTNNYSDALIEKNLKNAVGSFPNLKFKVIYDDIGHSSTDSIISLLKTFNEKQSVLVNTWSYRLDEKRRRDKDLNKKISSDIKAPVFSFMDQSPSDSIVIGGFVPPTDSFVKYTTKYADKILKGDSPQSLPHINIDNQLRLNHSALIYKGLYKNADKLYDVVYVNSAYGYLLRNYRTIFTILFIIIIIALFISWNRRSRLYNEEASKLFEEYKKLFEEYSSIYKNMPVGIALFNNNGDFIRANPEAYRIGSVLLSVFDEKTKEEVINAKEATTIMSVTVNNQLLYYRVMVHRINNSILIVFFDVTNITHERNKREEMSYLFEFAMDKSKLGVAEYNLLDGEGFATNTWYRNIRKQPDSSFENIYKFIVPEDKIKIESFLEDVKVRKRSLFADSVRVNSPIQQHWLRYVIKVMEYSPETNRIILAELNWNIDLQKEKEREMEIALKKAKESDLLKSGFIANMGLEITTPLNAIVGFSNLLCESDSLEEKATLNLQIEKNNDTLLKTIVNIIDITKIESDSIEFKYSEVDLRSLMREIDMLVKNSVNQEMVQVVTEEKGKRHIIMTDKERLYQIITCFTSNAENNTVKGSIKIGYALSGNQLYLYVTDTGEGIPVDVQASIQSIFSESGYFEGGRGFGLHIAKSLVKKMGGEIGFQSELGVGSTFWFRIPINVVEQDEEVV